MTKSKLKIIIVIFSLSIILVLVWGFLIEPNLIKTKKISLKIENLPGSFKDLKFLHISDLHLKEFGSREARVLKIIKDIKPDFIFITGDIVDWTTKGFDGLEKFSAELSINYRDRVFAVFGNHDHKNNKFKTVGNILEKNNVQVLINESRKLEINGDYFYIIGVDDPHSGYDNIGKALVGVEESSFKILLAHSPEIFRKIKDKKINLTLVGHTHGCQVGIPFLCDLLLPLDYDKQYKRGIFEEGSTYLYVNNGIGETAISFRLNAPPEITVINFESE